MHKSESILEKETHEILLDFTMQTHHLIPARRPDLELVNKKKKRKPNDQWTLPPSLTIE